MYWKEAGGGGIRCLFFFGGGREMVDKEEKNKNIKAPNPKLEIAKIKIWPSSILKKYTNPMHGFFYPFLSSWNAIIQI